MEKDRLMSYKFNCPCCGEPHKRLFEYFAKFYGFIPDEVPLASVPNEKSMLERVVMDDGTYEGRSLPVGNGESTFRCGNCFEYFKFDSRDFGVDPRPLVYTEKEQAKQKFKPITIIYRNAVMNALASFDSLINKFGCDYDEDTKELVVKNENGKEFRFDFAEQLVDVFYKNNPMFDMKCNEKWGLEPQKNN